MTLRNILLTAALWATAVLTAKADEPQAKYIFYYIGDGMGMGPTMTAQTYNRTVLKNDEPLLMMQFPTVSWCMTYSATGPVTDSAAAGTALSSGTKTYNGMIGMTPDTVAVTPIARTLKGKGYGIGVVTSVSPDDATPGAFYANVPARSMYYEIGRQAAACGYDFIAGAGLRGEIDKNGATTDLLDIMADNNVQIVRGPAEISRIDSRKALLLNTAGTAPNNIGYTIDSIAGVLSLPLITQTCLQHLEKNSPESFFMMVEGGNIDHALHANDGGAAVKEILNFNQALQLAYNFYLAHPDETLIVVTADHDTGGMALGNPKGKGTPGLATFDYQKVSKEEFSAYCKSLLKSDNGTYSWSDMHNYLADKLGLFTHIPVSKSDEEQLRKLFDETFRLRNTADQKTLYASFNSFAVKVFDIVSNAAGVAFTTTGHTGNPVPVFAIGVGAERFGSLNNNIDLPGLILEAAGLE